MPKSIDPVIEMNPSSPLLTKPLPLDKPKFDFDKGLLDKPMAGFRINTPALDQRIEFMGGLTLSPSEAKARDAFSKAFKDLKNSCPQCAGIIERPPIIVGALPTIIGGTGGGSGVASGSGTIDVANMTRDDVTNWIKSNCKSPARLFDARDGQCKTPAQVQSADPPKKS
jgi:hypothetical protein